MNNNSGVSLLNIMNIIIEVNLIQFSHLIEKISNNRNTKTFPTELKYHDIHKVF